MTKPRTYYIPELKLSVFISKGNTLKKWLKTQYVMGSMSKILWSKIKLKYKIK